MTGGPFGPQPVNAPADNPPSNINCTRLLRFLRFTGLFGIESTYDRGSHNDAHAQDHRRADDCRGDVPVLDDLSAQVPRRAFVEYLETNDRRHHADYRKQHHVADGLQQRLRVPRRWSGKWSDAIRRKNTRRGKDEQQRYKGNNSSDFHPRRINFSALPVNYNQTRILE
jgi:hypothetical protein